jgi:integrase
MARIGKLTALDVTRAKGPAVLHDGGGLYLRVSGTGAKSWVFRFQLGGKRRDMGLGPYPGFSLAEARGRAAQHRKQRHDGIDPLTERKAVRSAARLDAAMTLTFRECAESYITAHNAGWRNARHAAQWPTTLNAYVYPVFGALPVQAIDVGLVMKALEPIWTEKPETASRVRGRIESVIDWATARGYRQGENPARWRGHLENLLPRRSKIRRVEHHAALAYDDLPEFLVRLRGRAGMAALALEFVILTAARTGEALGATWGETDLSAKVWTVPVVRMKAGREHRVPLCDAALVVLNKARPCALMRNGDLDPAAPVFPGLRRSVPLAPGAMMALLRRMGRDDLTIHGFRSSFRDWAAESTNYPREVVEMALAHTVGDKVEAAYRRGDLFERRRRLMADWAQFCEGRPVGGEVVPIRA